MRDQLRHFSSVFSEIHYSTAFVRGRYDGSCYVFNNEMIVKVLPITIVDRVEFLFS
jgi:hypothetical protein